MRRREATRTSQPSGRSGTPSAGQEAAAADECLLHGVLGVGEVPVAADHGAEGLRGELAQQTLDAGVVGHTSGSGALMTWRTSMRWRMGAPPWPGAAEISAAISTARSGVSTSTMR